jgi:hypothetical protein
MRKNPRDFPFPSEGGEYVVDGKALTRVDAATPAPTAVTDPLAEAPEQPKTSGKGRKE